MAACTVLLSHTHVKGQQWWVVACHQLIVPKPRCRTSLKKRVVLKYSRYSTLKTTLRAVHVMAKEAALGCVGTAACAWGAAYKCKHQCWCRAVTAEAVDWKLETASSDHHPASKLRTGRCLTTHTFLTTWHYILARNTAMHSWPAGRRRCRAGGLMRCAAPPAHATLA